MEIRKPDSDGLTAATAAPQWAVIGFADDGYHLEKQAPYVDSQRRIWPSIYYTNKNRYNSMIFCSITYCYNEAVMVICDTTKGEETA